MDYLHNWREGLQTLFSKPKYALLFFVLLLFFAFTYSVLTDIIVLNPLSLNPVLNLPLAFLILLDALAASLGFTILLFQLSDGGVGTNKLGAVFGAGGGALTLFASACTFCQPIWLFWLGLGASTAFLANYSAYLAAASLLLLVWSLNIGFSNLARKQCP